MENGQAQAFVFNLLLFVRFVSETTGSARESSWQVNQCGFSKAFLLDTNRAMEKLTYRAVSPFEPLSKGATYIACRAKFLAGGSLGVYVPPEAKGDVWVVRSEDSVFVQFYDDECPDYPFEGELTTDCR